jgi:surfactin synthase thioesterase subunit
VGCPIHAFGGARDTSTPETLGAWRDHTHGQFFLDVLPGGHFFIFEQEAQLLGLMLARLSSLHGDPRQAHLPEPSRLGGAAEQAGGERSC